MKRCLRCGQSYSDETLNFCLNDGEFLVRQVEYDGPPTRFADDSPPTLVMNEPRVTNPIDWASTSPVQWENQMPSATVPYGLANYGQTRNKTLPTISLVL